MARARPHVVIARLNDEELRIYNWLLRSVAGVTYSKNKSKAFRTFLRRMAEYIKKQEQENIKQKALRYLLEWPDFQPAAATKGPEENEVSSPEEVEALEELETYARTKNYFKQMNPR